MSKTTYFSRRAAEMAEFMPGPPGPLAASLRGVALMMMMAERAAGSGFCPAAVVGAVLDDCPIHSSGNGWRGANWFSLSDPK